MTDTPATRLAELRRMLHAAGFDGFIVPHADEHQSEYLPASAERLAWLTGFDGSAGTAIVLADRAALFTDGRYTLQAARQSDTALFEQVNVADTSPADWLAASLENGDRICYDPWLTTIAEAKRLAKACDSAGAAFVPVESNPLDALWSDQPEPPTGAVMLHPVALAGRTVAAKLDELRAALKAKKADATVLTQADSIAWTFNIRGLDIAHNPAPLAWAILRAEGPPDLFIDGRKLSNAVRAELADHATLREPAELGQALESLGETTVLLDPHATNEAIHRALETAGARVIEGADPVALPKARKNAAELAGARAAHIRDGAAMVRFLAWLDREGAGLDEIAVSDRLEAFRAETATRDGSELLDLSFDTISGAGPNGAIVHYRATPEIQGRLEPGTLYLVDSGAQYRDGTTDITRTVAVGTPDDEMRDRYTRVLKGHLAISMALFPAGTSGAQIDALARLPLWRAGLDYDHGTGHGIGSYLSVHEGPARISKLGHVALAEGMILSNEPGYYKAGAWGIRIENLVVVGPAAPVEGGERPMHHFATLTLCPYDRRLIATGLMTPDEIAWVDAYHAGLAAALGHLLDENERAWLAAAARPLAS